MLRLNAASRKKNLLRHVLSQRCNYFTTTTPDLVAGRYTSHYDTNNRFHFLANHLHYKSYLDHPRILSTANLSSRSFAAGPNQNLFNDNDAADTNNKPRRKQRRPNNDTDYSRRPKESQKPVTKSKKRPSRINEHYRQLNRQIIQCESTASILDVLESTDVAATDSSPHDNAKDISSTSKRRNGNGLLEFAGGGSMDAVNYSTAWHRLAHHHHTRLLLQQQQQQPQYHRNQHFSYDTISLLSDTRFALFLCSTAEALSMELIGKPRNHLRFGPQAFSNIAWAIAKLQIIRPTTNSSSEQGTFIKSEGAIDTGDQVKTNVNGVSYTLKDHVKECCIQLRSKVDDALRHDEKAKSDLPPESDVTWTQELLALTKIVLDFVSYRVLLQQAEQMQRLKQKEQKSEQKRYGVQMFNTQDSANLLWALATTQRRQHGDLVQFLVTNMVQRTNQLDSGSQSLYPQHWSNAVWSLATLDMVHNDNGDMSLLPFVAKLMSSENGSFFATQFKPQELSNLAWGVSKLMASHLDNHDASAETINEKQQLDQQLEAGSCILSIVAQQGIRQHYRHFPAQELGIMCWSIANASPMIAHGTNSLWSQLFLDAAQQVIARQGRGFSSIDLCSIAWSFATATSNKIIDLDNAVTKQLFFEIAEALLRMDGELQGRQLSNLAWACATMQFKHRRLTDNIANEAVLRTKTYTREAQCVTRVQGGENSDTGGPETNEAFNGQAIANLSWALATLNHGNGLMESFAPFIVRMCRGQKGAQPTISDIAKVFDRHALANLAWACAVEGGVYPKELIEVLFLGLLGVGEFSDPNHLCKVHRDAGIDERAILPVLYLQIAMHLDMKKTTKICFSDGILGLLPLDFPNAWYMSENLKQTSGNSDGIHKDNSSIGFGVTAKTSKMQRDVSDAFTRIGFAHVEEYAITMEALAIDHDIRMAPSPIGILSLDLANVDSLIGIEVDGPSHFLSLVDSLERATPGRKKCDENFRYQFGHNEQRFEVDGPTTLKHRLLEGLGWKVIHIPYWEWESLQGDFLLEEKYCRELLFQVEHSP